MQQPDHTVGRADAERFTQDVALRGVKLDQVELLCVDQLSALLEEDASLLTATPVNAPGERSNDGHDQGDEHLGLALLAVAARRAGHPAVVTAETTHTYADVATSALQVARLLHDRPDWQRGARVGLLLPNSAGYLAAFYGVLLAGGVAVPLPPDVEPERLAHVVRACDTRIVVTETPIVARRRDLADNPRVAAGPRASSVTGDAARLSVDVAVGGDALAMVLFTSGSTGDPKGVMLSHRNLLANAESIGGYLPIDGDERALALMPFYHAFGNSVLQTHVLAGATLLVDGSLTFPETVVQALARHAATSFSGVPEAYVALLQRSGFSDRKLPALRYMTVAGGALEPALAEQIAARISPAEFYVMYGQSEATARLSYLSPAERAAHPGSIGRGMPGVELQVVDDDGRPTPPGATGRIRARGANIMRGYWNDPQGTARVLDDGWLDTGDLARIDADGFIYPQGRAGRLVKIQGYRIHPREVETFVTRRADVAQAVVVPFERAATVRLALYCLPESGASLTADEIRRLCLRELPRPKVPAYVEMLSELPLNAALKVDRAALARRASERAA